MLQADGSELTVRITSVVVTPDESRQFRILTMRPEATRATRTRMESIGHIKLVGLDEVRAAMGDRWAAVAEQAMATAEAVIKRRCGPQGQLFPCRRDEFSDVFQQT